MLTCNACGERTRDPKNHLIDCPGTLKQQLQTATARVVVLEKAQESYTKDIALVVANGANVLRRAKSAETTNRKLEKELKELRADLVEQKIRYEKRWMRVVRAVAIHTDDEINHGKPAAEVKS